MSKIFNKIPLLGLVFLMSCASYQQFQYLSEEFEIPGQLYRADYNQTWQAVLQVVQKYDLELQNQEAGVIKTRWIDNTTEINFSDSFSSGETIKAAKFRMKINVIKGYKGSGEVTRVTIYKRQLIEQDFLQGWKESQTDAILEKSILYRIERSLFIDKKLKEIEEQKNREVEKEASF
jgi:hypothetical protein